MGNEYNTELEPTCISDLVMKIRGGGGGLVG